MNLVRQEYMPLYFPRYVGEGTEIMMREVRLKMYELYAAGGELLGNRSHEDLTPLLRSAWMELFGDQRTGENVETD